MNMCNLPALIPGNLERLQTHMNANCPALAGYPYKAIVQRNIAGASALISAFSGSVSANIGNNTAKAVAALASVAFATIAAISTRGCLKTVEELESWLDKQPEHARAGYQADARIVQLSGDKKEV